MKQKIFSIVVCFLLLICEIFSQGIPQTINYQGVLKDASGNIVANGDYNLTFKLYETETGGSPLWTETKLLNVVDGIFSTQLGSITPITLPFDNAYWLGVTIGGGSEMAPRIKLASVPYSFMSQNVPDGSITAKKIANAEIVKGVNGLKDSITLVAGSNVTITPSGNNLTISADGGSGGIGGSGTANYLPLFSGSTTLGNSVIYQSNNNIGIGTTSPSVPLEVYGSPTGGQIGIRFSGNDNFNCISVNALGTNSKPGFRYEKNGFVKAITEVDNDGTFGISTTTVGPIIVKRLVIDTSGNVGIGTFYPAYPLHISTHRKYTGYFTSDSLSYNTHVIHAELLGTGNYDAVGVFGRSIPNDYYGYGGYFEGGFNGVRGTCNPTGSFYYTGVLGITSGGSGVNAGVRGYASGAGTNYGIYGEATGGTTNYAGYFLGNVNVTGTLSKGGGSFKIDHPLDPQNKYLYHSFVESPDMMNIYNGNVVTDALGYATVTLPDWFEALNKDFRYQLTVIGDFAQAIIYQKIQNNQFTIRTDKPNVEVSWQVTGIRHDAFAEKNRIPVEEYKKGEDVGKYLYPEAYGLSETMSIDYKHREAIEKRDKEK